MNRACRVPSQTRHVLVVMTLVTLAMLALSGCGIPSDPSARRISTNDLPRALVQPRRPVNLYVLRGLRLAPFESDVELTSDRVETARAILELLKKPLGSDAGEYDSLLDEAEAQGLRVESAVGDTVTVDLTDAPNIENQWDAIGQLLYSFTSVPGIKRLAFRKDGEALKFVRPPSGEAQALPIGLQAFTTLENPLAKLYFVKLSDNRIELIEKTTITSRGLEDTPIDDANALITELVSGPGPENEDNYRTAVSATLDPKLTDEGETFSLEMTSEFNQLGASEQLLALAQILQSVAIGERMTEMKPVRLVVDGAPIARIDGVDGNTLDAQRLAPEDFDSLVFADLPEEFPSSIGDLDGGADGSPTPVSPVVDSADFAVPEDVDSTG